MIDPRIHKMAQTLVEYSTSVQPGELVMIEGTPESAPLLLEIYKEVLDHQAHPYLHLALEGADKIFYDHAQDAQLYYLPEFLEASFEEIDARILVRSEVNTKRLSNADPRKQSRRTVAMRPLFDRIQARGIKWTSTLYPTQAGAQDAEMSLLEFEEIVFQACRLNETDPIASWQAVSQDQQRLTDWLSGKDQISIVAPDTDLTLSAKGRVWFNSDAHYNLPDGEITTGPVEDSVQGHIRFSLPACFNGREVADVHLWFEDGKVVKATAAKNEAFLQSMLGTDEGARYVGELAFGTNSEIQCFTKNILLDEKIGGTLHIALGNGYPQTGSKNRSAIHWDMICDLRQGGEVYVNEKLFMERGKIVI